MTEATKTPIHLWIVGVVSLMWNSFGAVDYTMTRTRGAAWIDQMMPGLDSAQFMAYIDGFPLWASIGWGLGVWGALVGSLLLLMRSRHALAAFAASLVGALAGIGYQLANPVNIPEMTQGAAGMMGYVIIAIALGLLAYVWWARRSGWLR